VDLQGQLLLEESPKGATMKVNLQKWKDGFYIVRIISTDGEVVNSKIEAKH
jgi:hypothetical protein